MNSKEITIRSYNQNAKGYSDWYYRSQIMASELDFFIDLLNKSNHENKLILDLGCGPGQDSLYLNSKGFRTLGVDLSPELLKVACEKVIGSIFLKLDIENELDKLYSNYAGIWACASLLHIKKELFDKVIHELYDLLENGGILFLSMMNGDGEILKKEERPFGNMTRYFAYYSLEEIERILLNEGFKILQKHKKGRWITIYAVK
jgi:SAM-dependent methyltransferase